MAWIVAVLAVISLVAGGFLGTFRHRAYGVWSLAGVLIAITTANIVGTSIGTWMAASIGTTEVSPVLVVVKTSVLVIVALVISYYASDLLPNQGDPKTRADNFMAGSLGVFNAYLVVASVLVYMQGLNNEFVRNAFGDGQGFNFNRLFIDALPWIASVLVLTIVGWSSVRKFKQAWAKLRGTSNPTPSVTTSTTSGTSYGGGYTQPSSGYTSSYAPSSTPTAVPSNDSSEKKGWFAGVADWFRRDKTPEAEGNPTNSASVAQTGSAAPYTSPTYQGTSGATPPYGIATGNAASGSSYSSGYGASTNTSSYNATSSYTAPATPSTTGYSSGYTAPSTSTYSTGNTGYSTSGYSATPATSPAASSYTPTSSYSSPTSTGYSSGYTTPASSTPGYTTGYGSTPSGSTSSFGAYNPNVSSGFNANPSTTPTTPMPSATDAAVGGMLAGGMFATSFGNQPMGNFADMTNYQDADDDDGSFGDDDDEDNNYEGYTPYRG